MSDYICRCGQGPFLGRRGAISLLIRAGIGGMIFNAAPAFAKAARSPTRPEDEGFMRLAIAEAAKIVNDDREKASIAISKFTKQPIELVKATPPNKSEPTLTPEQLAWWIEVMSSQNMLQSKLDTKKLVLN